MIAWMQKHNKYLVVTIWIATIAFIGAGFVGWGTYQYGKKATAIAEVGDIKITHDKFDFTYRNLYQKYNTLFKGKFDDKMAKEMQLQKQVFASLASQALLLNLANEYGIVVSDEELGEYIISLPYFQQNGKFDKKIYNAFLDNSGISAKSFENIVRDDLRVEKLMKLLDKKSLKFEQTVIASALSIEDKIAYQIISPKDINLTVSEKELKEYWQQHKSKYMTPKKYKLSILWTNLDDIKVDDKELRDFYNRNSYNYLDKDGKELEFEKAKKLVARDYRLKKGKKKALKAYIAFKKGKISASENIELNQGDKKLSDEIWKEIVVSDKGKIIKPKAVADKYATIKVEDIIEPREMNFEEAEKLVKVDFEKNTKEKLVDEKAEKYLSDKITLKNMTDYLKIGEIVPIKGLNSQESLQFFKKLFTSNKQIGIIRISDKRIVYHIISQRISEVDESKIKEVIPIADKIKSSILGENLIKELSSKYEIKKFVKGI